MIFDQNYRVLVTGASGMVGKSVVKLLQCYKNTQLLCPKRSDLDLTDKTKVFEYFEVYKPEIIFMLAAKVGGIQANIDDPINFLNDNLKIRIELEMTFCMWRNYFSCDLLAEKGSANHIAECCII